MTYDFTMHQYPRNQQHGSVTCQVLATQEWFLVLPDVTFAMLPMPNAPPSAIKMMSSCVLFLAFPHTLLCSNEFIVGVQEEPGNKAIILQLV